MCNGVKESRGQMKKYKLLKDLPTFKVGDIFYINDGGSLIHESDGVVAYRWDTLDKFPNILTDWFEEIKEPTRWKPKKYYEHYYYINALGIVAGDTWSDSTSIDRERFDLGNCFQTKEEAERVAEYLKALATVRGDATTKFVRGKNNWYVYYDTNLNSIHSSISYSMLDNGIFGLPYFATKEDAQRSIELHKKEWLTIFNCGGGNE